MLPGAPQPGPIVQPQPQDAPQPGAPSPDQLLADMLKLATIYHSVETDAQDRLKIERATTLIQSILADHQAQQHQLLGGGNQRALARTGL